MGFPNPGASDREMMTVLRFGFRAERPTAAPVTGSLFRITGGRIALLGIVGEVTTIIQTQADATKLVSTPTVGTALDICATLDITADEVGCLYGITGIPGDAMIGANAGASPMCLRPLVIPTGVIGLNCAATNTGSIKWAAFWLPLDDGAALAVA